ncbi:MAG: hypothetical protein WCV67_09975 [Victivallaceae bacterium]
MFFATALFCTAAIGAMPAPKRQALLNFGKPAETANYQVNPGVTKKIVKDTNGNNVVEVAVAPFSEHKNQWPSLGVTVESIGVKPWDLSNYSYIEVKIQKISEGLATVSSLLSSLQTNEGGANFDYFQILIPGGETIVQQIMPGDIVNPANDPSNLRYILFTFPATSKLEIYRLISVEGINDPAYSSLMDTFDNELKNIVGNFQALKQKTKKNYPDLEQKLNEIQKSAIQFSTKGFSGKYNLIRKQLVELNLKINAAFVAWLDSDLYCWNLPVNTVLDDQQKPGALSPEVKTLQIDMAQNEYRDVSFMLTSVRKDLNLSCKLSAPETLRDACDVFYTDYYYNYQHKYNAGDLIQPWTGPLMLPAGDAREVRVRVGGGDLPPGSYDLSLEIRDTKNNAAITMPVKVVIRPIKLVQYPDNYGYAAFWAGNQPEVDRHLDAMTAMKRYGLNVVEVPPVFLNKVTFDSDGNIATFNEQFLDYCVGGVNKMWRSLPGEQKIIFQLFCHVPPDMPKDASLHNKAYVNWIGKLVEKMRSFGLEYDQFCLSFGDEASQARLLDNEIPCAELVKKHFPEVLTFQNSSQVFSDEALNKRYFAAFDILAPNMDSMEVNPYLYPAAMTSGKLKSTYLCRHMGGLLVDVYAYYRVYLWRCFDKKIPSAGLWTFNAQESGLFREDQNINNVGSSLVNFNRAGKTVTTRRFEIYRDGINDWRYLLTLQALSKQYPEKSQEINDFLNKAVLEVLNNKADKSRAEKVRLRLADKILKISGK